VVAVRLTVRADARQGGVVGTSPQLDFFISYTAVNRSWAEWIAVQVERVGYTTTLQSWDFGAGTDFVHGMQEAVSAAARTIAVLSPAYFSSKFGEAEWRAVFVRDPSGELGLLVPVRVQPCQPPGLLASRVYIDLVDVDEVTARHRLLEGVDSVGARLTSVVFPGGPGAGRERFPGLGPRVSNLPGRNRNFSGRGDLLDSVHGSLQGGSAAAVVAAGAVHGLGGVGKTQLALEYAHRFASDYEVIWWINAEQATAAVAALAGLARQLGIPELSDQAEMVNRLFGLLRGRDRWLLVFDNAHRPEHLQGLVPPGGGGHVLVTSRWSAWKSRTWAVGLGVLAREESIEFLHRRTGAKDLVALDTLAELVGDLPLALEEAAAYLEETGESLDSYVELVRDRFRDLFGLEGWVDDEHGDRHCVATVWSVSLDRVRAEAPAAEALLSLCAFWAPDLPRGLPTEQPQVLPDDLAHAVIDPVVYNRMLAVVGRYSLATVTPTTIALHRLVQAVIRARLGQAGERSWAEVAVGHLRASFPDDSWEVRTWPQCERLLPHLLVVTGHAQRLGVAGRAVGWLLDRASTYLRERGQYQQARPLAERAVALTEAALGPQHVEAAWRHDNLGLVLQAQGDLASARKQYERALEISETTLGPDHPTVGTYRNNLGGVLQDQGDLAGARKQYERALEISETALGPDHPTVGTWRNNLGLVLRDQGDLAGARKQLERALEIGEAALGPDHPHVGTYRNNLGSVLQAQGDLAGARKQYERALEISETTLGPDHPTVGTRRNNLGSVLQAQGDPASARKQYERALEISETTLGPDHPHVGTYRNNLARILDDLG
jgi:tetratricopeptide (TPR) repeat protein